MIYTCQHCGGWFDAEDLNNAIEENKSTIICKFCNNVNDIGRMKTSHIAKGYGHLEIGDFYAASMEFGEALKHAHSLDISAKGPYLEAYLGHALAQFSVQVIYADEIADKNNPPEVNCYLCNEMYFEDCQEYQVALEIAKRIIDSENRKFEMARISRFAKFIDGVKRVYDKKVQSNTEYNLFIAYEDESKDTDAGFAVANKIRNNLPQKISNVFLPMSDNYISDEEYEGEILYAIHNSNCMLVVTDDDIDVRLMNIYSRYYWAMTTCRDKFKKKDLGFVRFKNKIHIQLPDHKIANHVFDFGENEKYHRFVYEANNLVYVSQGGSKNEEIFKVTDAPENIEFEEIEEDENAPIAEGNLCKFGFYPQRAEKDISIINRFKEFPKPTRTADNGWTVMFHSRDGQPTTWYLDHVIDGKKYRAIYFIKYRDVFTIRESDLRPSVQRIAQYTPMHIYVFAYEPVEWNILDISSKRAVLVSAVGLDCREFNDCELCANWECSSIRAWLNEDFYNTAFTDEQKKYFFKYEDDEAISLLDSELDLGKKLYRDKINSYNINGSDYFKCIGGFCDRNVANFWIKYPEEYDDKAAAIQPHAITNIVPQCVDNTAVSVVPKIIVSWNKEN